MFAGLVVVISYYEGGAVGTAAGLSLAKVISMITPSAASTPPPCGEPTAVLLPQQVESFQVDVLMDPNAPQSCLGATFEITWVAEGGVGTVAAGVWAAPRPLAEPTRAVLTELVFASDLVGSGVDWATTTGFNDDETIRLLRSIQRKLVSIARRT